jgi:hypothetical protein
MANCTQRATVDEEILISDLDNTTTENVINNGSKLLLGIILEPSLINHNYHFADTHVLQ